MSKPRIGAVVLAAGKGTRLKTELPKVLHEVCGRPMLAHVFDACREAGVESCIGVVGYKKDMVIEAFEGVDDVVWVEQNPQNGTGHAVMVCREQIEGKFDHVFVLCGDGPLIRSETLKTVLDKHLSENAVTTLATAELENPDGYGRIHRDADGNLLGIVEHGDCTPEQRQIKEVNPSYYCFSVPELLSALEQIKPNNIKNEYYITDCVSLAIEADQKVQAITAVPPEDIFSTNSRQDLALVNRVMRDRVNQKWMDAGVTIIDPDNTWIDPQATIGQDTVIHPFTVICDRVTIGRNCVLEPFTHIAGEVEFGDGIVIPSDMEGEDA